MLFSLNSHILSDAIYHLVHEASFSTTACNDSSSAEYPQNPTRLALNSDCFEHFFLLSFYVHVVAVVERTQSTSADRCWSKFQVCPSLALRPCIGQLLPWAFCFFSCDMEVTPSTSKDVMRREVKIRYSAWCIIEDYSHNYWFPSTRNSTWHIIGSSNTLCWMNDY